MTISALSSASFLSYAPTASSVTGPESAIQALKQSLADGNLTAAQTALTSLQKLNQSQGVGGSATANAQLTTDLAKLGSAIASGKLNSARQSFATVETDLQNNPSLAIAAAVASAQQTVQWIDDLISLSGLSPKKADLAPDIADLTTAILKTAYGTGDSTPAAGASDTATGAGTGS